jgi:hypothetical protein
MGLQKFDMETLTELDGGRIRTAFEQAMKRLEHDCKDRPNVKAARKLELVITMTPLPDDAGDLDSVDVKFRVKDSVPKRESKAYNMRAVPGGLLFNELSPDDVRQQTLDMAPKPAPVKEATNAG